MSQLVDTQHRNPPSPRNFTLPTPTPYVQLPTLPSPTPSTWVRQMTLTYRWLIVHRPSSPQHVLFTDPPPASSIPLSPPSNAVPMSKAGNHYISQAQYLQSFDRSSEILSGALQLSEASISLPWCICLCL